MRSAHRLPSEYLQKMQKTSTCDGLKRKSLVISYCGLAQNAQFYSRYKHRLSLYGVTHPFYEIDRSVLNIEGGFTQRCRRAFAEHALVMTGEPSHFRKSKFHGDVTDPRSRRIGVFEGHMGGTQSLVAEKSYRPPRHHKKSGAACGAKLAGRNIFPRCGLARRDGHQHSARPPAQA